MLFGAFYFERESFKFRLYVPGSQNQQPQHPESLLEMQNLTADLLSQSLCFDLRDSRAWYSVRSPALAHFSEKGHTMIIWTTTLK